MLQSLSRGWWFVVAGTVTAVIGGVVGFFVPKALDPQRPIAVNVVSNPATVAAWGNDTFSVVLPADARPATPPPLTCGSILDWAHGNGGVDQEATRVRLVVQGASDKGVLIDGMRARPIRRTATPDPGGISLACGGPQGVATPRRIAMDLDRAEPSAEYATKVDGRLPLFGFTLQKGETEVFELTASTKGTVEWVIVLDLVVDGKAQSVEVTNHGQSFRTTGFVSPRGYRVMAGADHWVGCAGTPSTCGGKPVSPADFRYS
ncbi:hypothetical protein F6X68_30880 [Micromonospora sp. AMSO12t]|uniref:hypothetical protein n=1 Tax=Micromonospora sp. AMSO12t TaxID=2650410 RepID=UPI00124BBDD2|nr:hypothetical protein [Micromonospora sp. AMSO12t]KAB1128627.1 hypothetical protein F6X68_30880 [Micromonospora sp. AMSO12t]